MTTNFLLHTKRVYKYDLKNIVFGFISIKKVTTHCWISNCVQDQVSERTSSGIACSSADDDRALLARTAASTYPMFAIYR